MTSRDEAIKIAVPWVKGLSWHNGISIVNDDGVRQHPESFRLVAAAVYDAMLAAGVIPAEGAVVVDAKQWEDTSDLADALCQWVDGVRYSKREDAAEQLTADGMLSWDDLSYAVDEFRASYVDDGDLDAIPAAPTGEGEA